MMNRDMATKMANDTRLKPVCERTGGVAGFGAKTTSRFLVTMILVLLVALTGCESDDDCINCVELPLPVVPTGVRSISRNNEVIIEWYDIAYAPYDDSYNENVATYYIYSREYQYGDKNDPDRDFFKIGKVDWDDNYDGQGLHWFYDVEAVNGKQYEYAVAAVNAAGGMSALSLENVIDAPLPMSPIDSQNHFISVRVYDANGANGSLSGFDFRLAGLNPTVLTAGVVNPAIGYDIAIRFEGANAYVLANLASTRIQDYGSNDGSFTGDHSDLIFRRMSWAPEFGYSDTGKLELLAGHVYVVEIIDPITDELHYAKFGIDQVNLDSVDLIWAYQLIPGLPELKASLPDERTDYRPQLIKM